MKIQKTSISINNRINEVASTIYFGNNEKAIEEWRIVQDEYWKKYNFDSLDHNDRSWFQLSLSDQIIALRKGRCILKKYRIKVPEIYKAIY